MSRIKTISWMLLVIIVIGIVAILTRAPVHSDAGHADEAIEAPAAADTSPADTTPGDGTADEVPGDAQNSSQ